MTAELESWIGREERRRDRLDAGRAAAMAALLDRPQGLGEGEALPPLWHWLWFWDLAPTAALGEDGHAARGEFLPPVALPRRMWAGSRLTFHRPLPLGCEAERRSTILSVKEKQGRSGRLVFVTVGHEVTEAGAEGPALSEEHDIVYREAPRPDDPAPSTPQSPPESPQWSRLVEPAPVLLFRYSALTFNGHRIHYDADYCREREGYPGLVVHGPLLATLMLEEFARALSEGGVPPVVADFSFRALSPVFATGPFAVAGRLESEREARVWVADTAGGLAMAGQVGLLARSTTGSRA